MYLLKGVREGAVIFLEVWTVQEGMPTTSCGSIEIIPQFDPSKVTAECSLDSSNIDPGESVGISVNITNTNQIAAFVIYEVTVNAIVVASGQTTVDSNSSTAVSEQKRLDFVGSYDVGIDLTASGVGT